MRNCRHEKEPQHGATIHSQIIEYINGKYVWDQLIAWLDNYVMTYFPGGKYEISEWASPWEVMAEVVKVEIYVPWNNQWTNVVTVQVFNDEKLQT